MIEINLRRGQIAEANSLAMQARKGGYVAPGDLFYAPLELICRKAETLAETQVARK